MKEVFIFQKASLKFLVTYFQNFWWGLNRKKPCFVIELSISIITKTFKNQPENHYMNKSNDPIDDHG